MSEHFLLALGLQQTALLVDLPVRGSEIQIHSWLQSESEASLGLVREREKERCQMSEHGMEERYTGYRKESGWNAAPPLACLNSLAWEFLDRVQPQERK